MPIKKRETVSPGLSSDDPLPWARVSEVMMGMLPNHYRKVRYLLTSIRSNLSLAAVGSENRTPFYWYSVLVFLTATLFSFRAFEHIFGLHEWKIGRKSIPSSCLLPTKLINPTIFIAVSLISGWSAQSAFVAVELSVPLGFATSACRRENWELRGSLGELIKDRFPSHLVSTAKSYTKTRVTQTRPVRRISLKWNLFECSHFCWFRRSLYSVYVDIAHILRDIVPGSLRNNSLL